MIYRFRCPGPPRTKGFRHHVFVDRIGFGDSTSGTLGTWLDVNIGKMGTDWDYFVRFINPEVFNTEGVDEYYSLFVFRKEDHAMLFRLTWDGSHDPESE